MIRAGALRPLGFAIALLVSAAAAALAQPRPPGDAAGLRSLAFEHAQRAISGAASHALAQLDVRFAAGNDALAAAVRTRQDLIAAWQAADRALVQAMAAPHALANINDLKAEVEALRAGIAASESALTRDFPAYAELSIPRPLSLSEAQGLLDADEALVLFLSARKETFVFVLTRDRVETLSAPIPRDDLVADIRRLRLALDPVAPAVMRSGLRNFEDTVVESGGDAAGGRVAFDRRKAHELYRLLLAPAEAILAGKTRVFLIQDAPLDSLPLSVLVTSPPEGSDTNPDDLRRTGWLLRRHALVTLPSVASLRTVRRSGAMPPAPHPFRGYGAPALGHPGAAGASSLRTSGTAASLLRDGRVDRAAVRALAPLPQTRIELERLATALGAPATAISTGREASLTTLRQDDLAQYRIIAFATHGLIAGELTGLAEPALVFTPPEQDRDGDNGLLTATEAARLRLNADWVVLSACNTAAGDGTPGAEGLSGLARAFFYAGARSLLVTHWPVRDDIAARLTASAFRALAARPAVGKANAFRDAALAVLEDRSEPAFAHPALWAPFVVVGEGR